MNGDTERKRERRLYPFEKEEQKNRYEKEDRPYSGAHDGERTVENGRVMSRGKGRRDGNSAASIVRHSGKAPYGGGRRREDSHGRPGNDRRDRRHGEAFGKEKRGYEKGVDDFSSPLTLTVSRNTEIGTFLELPDGEKVLLPFSEQTRRPEEGERIQVFLFKDKGDRITATMRRPKLREGELGILSVSDVTRIGAFLDNGVPKEVLLPFSEQVSGPKPGDEVLVHSVPLIHIAGIVLVVVQESLILPAGDQGLRNAVRGPVLFQFAGDHVGPRYPPRPFLGRGRVLSGLHGPLGGPLCHFD